MRITTKLLIPFALTTALVFAAVPAQAQQRDGNRRGAEARGGQARGPQARGERPAPAARADRAVPRPAYRRPVAPPSRPYSVFRDSNRYGGGFSVRGGVRVVPRVLDRRAFIVGGTRFYRPYYTFRPRLSLGFGLWVGYPVPYPVYATPYLYGDPYPYTSVAPSAPYDSYEPSVPYDDYGDGPVSGEQPGGLSFSISPRNAAIYIDGVYAGTADEFGADAQPLGLAPGRHRVEIRASGYQTMTFDADVEAGQVVPYQATLRR